MKVYVVMMHEDDWDDVIGIFASVEAAQMAYPRRWEHRPSGEWNERWSSADMSIVPWEVQGVEVTA